MKIKILITGGTIDGIDVASGKTTIKSSLLLNIQSADSISSEVLMLKDSTEITDKDRALILEKCKSCIEDKIVITHGTNTMVETGQFLLGKVAGKTIILTGAMIPTNEDNSDASVNLASALTAVRSNAAGVYIAMNGKIFLADKVKKNFKKMVFEESEASSDDRE